MKLQKPIAITAGEPAGIGYDILVQAAQQNRNHAWLVFADPNVLLERAKQLKLPLQIELFSNPEKISLTEKTLTIFPTPCAEAVIPGILNVHNAKAVVQGLTLAAQMCLQQQAAALVTLPVHKGIICDSGLDFSGHTEFFAKLSHTAKVVMMLAAKNCRVALVTTHLPLHAVPAAITEKNISETIRIVHQHLQRFFQLEKPTILVTGLNPHAGENGHLGDEEINIITPALNKLQKELTANIIGPLAADTLFQPKYLDQADAIISMYHDQGLAPIKAMHFGEIVNITCGLPFIRTSVDHGVALDIAGTGTASAASFFAALEVAEEMAIE